jgi:hypothetical protein
MHFQELMSNRLGVKLPIVQSGVPEQQADCFAVVTPRPVNF